MINKGIEDFLKIIWQATLAEINLPCLPITNTSVTIHAGATLKLPQQQNAPIPNNGS